MEDCLTFFAPETAAWFRETLGAPTPVQELSWGAIAAGGHVLVSAPTGTGKTLSAFLVFLDRLKKQAVEGARAHKKSGAVPLSHRHAAWSRTILDGFNFVVVIDF